MSQEAPNLRQIELRCGEILGSAYLVRELPPELRNLKALLRTVALLAREDVPGLVSEVKSLRAENKRLEAEVTELRSARDHTTGFDDVDESEPAEPSLSAQNGHAVED